MTCNSKGLFMKGSQWTASRVRPQVPGQTQELEAHKELDYKQDSLKVF